MHLYSLCQGRGGEGTYGVYGGILALHAHCALLLDYVPPEEPLGTPLGNTMVTQTGLEGTLRGTFPVLVAW